MRRSRFILSLFVALSLCGACAAPRRALVGEGTRVLKLKVTQTGDVYLDGQSKTLDETFEELARLKRERGAVLYYREDGPQHQPHPNGLKVVHKIEELGLPFGLSEKDFE
ncbi:MAG TPA: hypothetical protein VKB12_08765 [Pyrinomonadaceae bacterium]|nr:hypothetical protein [Pyrinomonadaceae bacterium]